MELSQDNQKKEKVLNMFRHFGSTHKEAITDRTTYAGSQVILFLITVAIKICSLNFISALILNFILSLNTLACF